MNKEKFKFWVDFFMGVSFLVVAITGFLKFPNLRGNFSWIFTVIDFRTFSRIHDLSGAIMSLFVLIHLILNWQWIKCMVFSFFKKSSNCKV
jgi:hypothetical protein